MNPKIKICGIRDAENLRAAQYAGADFAGFVFYPQSVRYIAPVDVAAMTDSVERTATQYVGLFVNPDDEILRHAVSVASLDMIQLHGEETPDAIEAIQDRFGLPVMKAIRVGGIEDLRAAAAYDAVADWLLFDAKIAGEAGGTGQVFDWSLLRGQRFARPWMLSGGLNAANIGAALKDVSPHAVDVSSGVESARGVKDPRKIAEFIAAVKRATG